MMFIGKFLIATGVLMMTLSFGAVWYWAIAGMSLTVGQAWGVTASVGFVLFFIGAQITVIES